VQVVSRERISETWTCDPWVSNSNVTPILFDVDFLSELGNRRGAVIGKIDGELLRTADGRRTNGSY
jgi:hypothetical protein